MQVKPAPGAVSSGVAAVAFVASGDAAEKIDVSVQHRGKVPVLQDERTGRRRIGESKAATDVMQ